MSRILPLDFLVIHCTATPEGRHVFDDDIKRWHMGSKEDGGRGWSRVGYSDMIYIGGELINLVHFNQNNMVSNDEMTWGAVGINARSRHLVYVGGLKKFVVHDDKGDTETLIPHDTRTCDQEDTMEIYVKYMIKRHPTIRVAGHNQFSKKACPSFNVPEWAKSIGIPYKNIYYGGEDKKK